MTPSLESSDVVFEACAVLDVNPEARDWRKSKPALLKREQEAQILEFFAFEELMTRHRFTVAAR
jgi:hypothetical protein